MANKIRDLTWLRVGKLVAVHLHSRDESGRWRWLMRCDCGALTVRKSANIIKASNDNAPSSCGCDHHLKTHGLSKTNQRLRWVWSAMLSRCRSKSNKDYQNYGARGISVCAAWHSFEAFVDWALVSGYAQGMTIERTNVNEGYSPDNCTWVANEMQARNRRHTHWFTHDGKTLDIRGWSIASGVSYFALRTRLLNYKWNIERAISEPVRVRS